MNRLYRKIFIAILCMMFLTLLAATGSLHSLRRDVEETTAKHGVRVVPAVSPRKGLLNTQT